MSSQKSEAEITREEDERHHALASQLHAVTGALVFVDGLARGGANADSALDLDSDDNFSEGSAEAHSELAGVRPMLWNGRLPQRSFTGPAVSAGSSEYYLEEELPSWMQALLWWQLHNLINNV